MDPILPSRTSWEFSKREECVSIIKRWQMYFQASDLKRKHFLDLNDNDNEPIHPTYSKGSAWLKHLSNSLCAHVTRLITNYAPIGEYQIRFFPNESFARLCSNSSIETRSHILNSCAQYIKSWNPKRESLKDMNVSLRYAARMRCDK